MKESWFRVHTSILDCRKFEGISLAARGLWVTLCALAKERDCNGRLVRRDGTPMDVRRIAREIGYDVDEVGSALEELVGAGLVEQDADGTYRLHDWDEWQTREEERERWRAYKRQKEEAPACSNTFQDFPTVSNDFQHVPTISNDFQDFPTASNDFQDFPTGSNDFQDFPLETKTKTKTKSENNNGGTALRASPPDDDLTRIVQGAYAEAGLDPPNPRTLALGKKAVAEIFSKSPPPSRDEVSRTAAHCLRTWRSFSWKSFAEQFERELARLRGDLPPPNGRRPCVEPEKEPRPGYYRLVTPPQDWGGLA